MKVYYAHHKLKYNTPIEEYEIELIKDKLEKRIALLGSVGKEDIVVYRERVEVFNPNGGVNQELKEKEIMEECLRIVREECSCLAFSSVNGVIGFGVWQEVNEAFANNKEVYYIYNNKLIKLNEFNYTILNYGKDWKFFASVDLGSNV